MVCLKQTMPPQIFKGCFKIFSTNFNWSILEYRDSFFIATPFRYYRCSSNCGSKLDPTSSLKLVANCKNCDSVNTDDMVYSWKVLEMPDEIDVTDRVRPLMATDIDKETNFVSLPHAFTPGWITTNCLNHFKSMFYFYTPWKRQKSRGFLTFAVGIEKEVWPEMN